MNKTKNIIPLKSRLFSKYKRSENVKPKILTVQVVAMQNYKATKQRTNWLIVSNANSQEEFFFVIYSILPESSFNLNTIKHNPSKYSYL